MNDSFRWSGDEEDFQRILCLLQREAKDHASSADYVANLIKFGPFTKSKVRLEKSAQGHQEKAQFFGRMAADLESALEQHAKTIKKTRSINEIAEDNEDLLKRLAAR